MGEETGGLEPPVPQAYISATACYLPPRIVTNQDLIDDFGIETSDEWIVKRTGIHERRFADEGVGPAQLAVPAAREALDRAGLAAADLEMIIFATLSPEHAFPGSGVYLQAELGAPGVPALDVRNQCSGFLYGLATAASMVQSGAVRHAMVVGAEVHSAALDFSTRGRSVASLFGDAAGVAIVSATEEDRGIRSWALGADGRYADVLCQKVWDTRKRPFIPIDSSGRGIVSPEDLWARMDGRQVFKHAVEKMATSLMSLCWDNKVAVDDLDLVLFHQANLRINQMVQDLLRLPKEKVPNTINRYGNVTAATLPVLLAEQERAGKIARGDRIAMVAFGSGFTWGAALLEW